MNKLKPVLSKLFHWIFNERLAEVIIFIIVSIAMYLSVAVYYLNYIDDIAENTHYNFEMAILSATLGGFILIGGFIGNTHRDTKKDLINAAKGFLTSAVFSTIFGFVLPVTDITNPDEVSSFYFFLVVVLASMMIAIAGFVWGISILIPCLWKIGRKSDKK